MFAAADSKLPLYRDLIVQLVTKEFKVRYKSTLLGYVWSILNPLAFTLVYYYVFRVVARFEMEEMPFSLFLVTGLFPWQWFQNSLTAANGFFLNNASLIKKVNFPRSFLVLTGVLNDLVHFLVSVPVIAGFMLALGRTPSFSWIWQIPLMVSVQFALTYGIALVISTANVFFRDLERLIGIFLMLWFFLTPIVYPPDQVPTHLRWLLEVNPVAFLAACWRGILIHGEMPWAAFARTAIWAAFVAAVGTLYYRRFQWRFAEVV